MQKRLLSVVSFVLLAAACSVRMPEVRITGSGPQTGGAQDAGIIEGAALKSATASGGVVTGSTGARPASCDVVGPGVTDRSVKIGSSVALSGPLRALTAPAIRSVQAYFNTVNARGGVHGRKIDLVFRDDGWDAQKGMTNIKTLVAGEKVLAMTLSSTNGVNAATGYLNEQRVPVLGMSGALSSQFRSPVIFPVGTPFDAVTRMTIHDIATRLKVRTLAVIWIDVAVGVEVREALSKALPSIAPSVSLVASRRVSISEPTMEPVLNEIQNQVRGWQSEHGQRTDGRPDYLLFALDPANAVKAMQAAERLGFRPRIGWGGLSSIFLDLVLKSTDLAAKSGLYASSPFVPALPEFEYLPAMREYLSAVRRYVDEGDVRSPVVQLGWIAAALTVRALEDAGPCPTRERIIAAADRITGWTAGGLVQPLTFRPLGTGAGHMANPWSMIVQAVPKGAYGCTRAIGCWHWVQAKTPNGWHRDPALADATG